MNALTARLIALKNGLDTTGGMCTIEQTSGSSEFSF